MHRLSDNMKGAVLMSAAMAGFVLNDVTVKFSASHLGVFQVIFIRGLFATVLIGALAWHRKAFYNVPTGRDRLIIGARSLLELCATILFLLALFRMQIANITAILQSLPLAITLAAALFSNESIGLRRGIAILAGFMGVLIIVRPGVAGFDLYSLLPLAVVVLITIREMITRQLTPQASSLFASFITAAVITTGGGIGVVVSQVWNPVSVSTIAMLALAAVFLFMGYYGSIATMRIGEIAVIAPFRYTMMLWAIVLGYFVFGDVPDGWTLFGMAIVVGMGVFTFYRERKVASGIYGNS
jgi:drug/metabolite transporter (DMT)-like permease